MVCFQKLENPSHEAMKICVFLNLLSIIDIKTGIDMSLSSSLNSAPWIATGMGTSINDVPRFLAFFDLPTYPCPFSSHLEKAAYLMTSFFV